MQDQRLVIVGAGPIGLEAAVRASSAGYDVTVLERGQIGAAIRHWQHVQLFTPFGMNSSEAGRACLKGTLLPGMDECLTGQQYVDRYLQPLADSARLAGRVRTNSEVIAVSRRSLGKTDQIGKTSRADQPFRILIRTEQGERIVNADMLLDCSGFTNRHRFIGAGGMPCPGELTLLTDEHYHIPNKEAANRDRFCGKHTLVVGSGYSAATSICVLVELNADEPHACITWITRGDRATPLQGMPNDSLPERDNLTNTANELAMDSESCVRWKPGCRVEAIARNGDQFDVQLSHDDAAGEGRVEVLRADNIVANPGYRPNIDPFTELQIHRCYATEGPIKLAAHLLGETSGDCLQQTSPGWELLRNPEPNFYILGAASYGRDSRFLLQTGLQQVDQLFEHLATTEGSFA